MTTLSADHPNADLLRRAYEAWGAGDRTSFVGVCSGDATWHVAGSNRLSGDHVGHEAIEAVLETLQGFEGGAFCTTYDGVFASDTYGLVVTSAAATAPDGEDVSWRVFDIFRFSGGEAMELWTFASPQSASDRVWA